MPDPDSTRPRLVSVGEDHAEKPAKPPAAEGSDPAFGPAPRRVLWLAVVVLIAVVAGLVAQTQRVRALRDQNEELTSELFATRSALDAYVARFAAVRESVDGLQAQFEQLGALVNADPLAPPEPEAGAEPSADPLAPPEPESEAEPSADPLAPPEPESQAETAAEPAF